MSPCPEIQPLPAGAVLLHIGPHKTGTSALQGAFHVGRDRLAEHGVRYAGPTRQPWKAALAAVGRPGRPGDLPSEEKWAELVAEVATAADERVVISSEAFADARARAIPAIVSALGGDRVHVVVTARPIVRILPSQWQQRVRNGMVTRYPVWLRHTFRSAKNDDSRTLWRRHAYGRLVRRWVRHVGADRVIVVVVDDDDRDATLRAFEALCALPHGALVPESTVVNRSLSAAEIEVIRRLNRRFRSRRWPERVHRPIIRQGIIEAWQASRPDALERPIRTPRWASRRAARMGARAATAIEAAGVTVIGDLGLLSRTEPVPAAPLPPRLLTPRRAATALAVAIEASREAPWLPPIGDRPVEQRPIGNVSSKILLRVVAQRLVGKLRLGGSPAATDADAT